jgi:transcriptional regulator with GAF, ATPase, and Fis domain
LTKQTPDGATGDEERLASFERLAIQLSSRLAGLSVEALPAALEDALRQIAESIDVDRSSVFEFNETTGAIEHMYSWSSPHAPELALGQLGGFTWYFDQLRRGEVVRFGDLERETPPEAAAERAYVAQSKMKANLTIPVSIGGKLVSALAVGTFRHPRVWPDPLVDRMRLIAEIVAGALQRRRHELALRASLAEIRQLNKQLRAENLYLREEIKAEHDFEEIIGDSETIRLALARVEQVAPTDSTVLLLGESGTGKELMARAIHERSGRKRRPIVHVNCAALPATLIESELFGHERGAFTGAVEQRQGRFEVADQGTLLLDEIGDLPLEVQGRLLRVLEEGTFERVGSSRTRHVDVRVVAATNRDLERMVRDGAFRADLYYRLSVFPIVLPPLRDRREDIPALVWAFIAHHQRRLGRRIDRVPRAIMDALQRYDWPGNVRELNNVIERAMIRSTGDVLEIDEMFAGGRRRGSRPSGGHDLASVERDHIQSILEACGWRINGHGNAAERLGLHPNTLRFRMKKLGIMRPVRAERRRQAGPQRPPSPAPR